MTKYVYEIVATRLNCEGNPIGIASLGFYLNEKRCMEDLQKWKDKWNNDKDVRFDYANNFRLIQHKLND